MVRIAFILAFIVSTLSIQAQVLDTIFNGYLSPMVDTGGSAPTWHFKAQFVNEGKTFTGATVTSNAKIIVSSGGRCYELDIDSVGYINGLLRGTVTDASGVLTDLPGYGAIITPTSEGFYTYPSGLPQVLQSCIQTQNWLDVASSTAGNNIDSSFIRNDSTFISQGGQEYFTGAGPPTWYYYAGYNATYSLPLDTLAKYDRIFILAASITTSTITLPDIDSDPQYDGKIVEIRYSGSGKTIVKSDDGIYKYNCSGYGVIEANLPADTLTQGLYDLVRYTVSGSANYLRHCPAINTPSSSPPDTARFIVYAPSHGLSDSITTNGLVPVKIDFTQANASAFDSTHFAYAVDAPTTDSLELKLSGTLTVAGHGLTVGRLYYLQDDGTFGITSGTIRAPIFYVLDANTLILTEVGSDQDQVISRRAVPSPVFTFWGGDPQNPSDSIMQVVVDSVFAPAGLAKPSTIFFMSYSSQSKNPTYQEDSPTDSPLNPSHSWFYDGNVVTRMNHLLTSVDLQATSAGLFTLDTVQLIGGIPTDSTVANWLDSNYVNNNLRLPNGAILYWQGNGTPQSPDYSWMVIDDITNTTETNDYRRILKSVKTDASNIKFDTVGNSLTSSNIQEAIEEILEATNFGNVLYVTAGGNDSIAVKGELFKAWDDPWEAVANASAGDLVYVYPGTYTTSGNPNLWKPGVTMYFSPEAIITQRPIISGSITTSLFYCNTPGEMNIYGGKFSTFGDAYFDTMIFIDTSDVSINVYGAQTVTQAMLAYGAINSSVNLNSIENLGRVVFTTDGIKADSTTDVTVSVSGNMYGYFHDAVAFIKNNSKITRIEARISIGDLDVESFFGQGDRGLVQFSSSGSPMDNISISATINKGRIDNRVTDARIMLYGANNLTSHTNVRYNMHCNQCRFIGSNKISITGSNVKRLRGVSGVISGNYYFNGGAVMIGGGGSRFDANTNIIFDGTFIGETGELVDSIATGVPFTFKGTYKVNVAKPVFAWTSLTASTYANFRDATLINEGGEKIVVPAGAFIGGTEHKVNPTESTLFQEVTAAGQLRSVISKDSFSVLDGDTTVLKVDSVLNLHNKYSFPNTTPSSTSGAVSVITYTGDGAGGNTAAMKRMNNGVAFDTTDGSGDITVTIPQMPDATFTVLATAEASTFNNVTITSKTTTSFTARFFDATGAAITSTGVVLGWQVIDY